MYKELLSRLQLIYGRNGVPAIVVTDSPEPVWQQQAVQFLVGKGSCTVRAFEKMRATITTGVLLAATDLHEQISAPFQISQNVVDIFILIRGFGNNIEDIGREHQVDIQSRLRKLIRVQNAGQ